MVRPKSATIHDNIDLKLGIKSSLPSVKPTLALLFLLWRITNKPSELDYSIADQNRIILNPEIEEKLYADLSSFSSSVTKQDFNAIINKNLMLNSQLEALIVTFELVWKVAKIRFSDGRPNSSERKGGARYPKTLWFTANMDLFDISFSENNEITKLLYNWLGINVAFSSDAETQFIQFLTLISESAFYKLKDGDNDVVFNLESLYDTILSSDDTVDVSGDDEAKGSLRILKSALSENLFYNLQSKNNAVSSEDKEQLRKYAERVSMLHQLNPNNYAETDDSRDPSDDLDTLTVEWFNENGKALTYLDDEAQTERENFLKKYGPELLRELEGLTLIRTVFLNDENKNNLCYELEFNSKNVELFGSIKSGTAYKYGLHFSKKNQKWATGTARTPKFISVDEAIELGTQIRDCLIAGAEIILNYKSIDSIDGYKKLYTELNEATDGYINRVWFLKYYQMIAPHLFPPIYSQNAQTTVLKAIGETPDINSVVRMGQLQLFINHCEISSVVFSRTFWSNYDRTVQDEDEITSEYKTQLKFKTGLECPYSRNRILFGAPGTGKSHNLNNETVDLVSSMNGEYERVTFHPDYSYANFVGTYKPVPTMDSEDKETITYKFVPGPFMRVLKNALKNANSSEESVRPFILVIEEINRANVAAVFGDVFQLLDRDDDNVSAYKIEASEDLKKYLAEELGGSPESYAELRIPDNMFIWATMNSADQGVFPMDTAFKRRWDFTYLGIDNGEENIAEKFVTLGKGSYERKVEWNKLRKAINNVLSSKEFKINEDKLMGPFFLSTKVIPLKGDIDEKKFVDAFKSKVIMYLFEDAAKQKKHTLFNGCKDTTRYSSIRDEFDEKGVFIFCNEVHNKFPAQSQDGETE